jgi:hypothetical protein
MGSINLSLKSKKKKNSYGLARPLSHDLQLMMAGLQFLWLASRLKPWLRAMDGLCWLTAAYGLQQRDYNAIIETAQILSQFSQTSYSACYQLIISTGNIHIYKIVYPKQN